MDQFHDLKKLLEKQINIRGELEKLADLRDKGVITDKEFDKKKKLILGI